MTTVFELTDSELEMVMQMRRENELAQKRADYMIQLLQLATEYATWLCENGIGGSYTYSTFYDDFGYDYRCDVMRSKVYHDVRVLMNTAVELASAVEFITP